VKVLLAAQKKRSPIAAHFSVVGSVVCHSRGWCSLLKPFDGITLGRYTFGVQCHRLC